MKTIFITGSSTGIGKATVEHFLSQGWQVIATVRDLDSHTFVEHPNLRVMELDVTNEEQVQTVVTQVVSEFSQIDVLINNAGYGLMGAFEDETDEEIRAQFDTNFFGLLNVTRAFLPHFREKNGGLILNIASMMSHIGLPFFSAYSATKWAVEGFTESLQFELDKYHIQVKLIEPGNVRTNFFTTSLKTPQRSSDTYQEYFNRIKDILTKRNDSSATPESVAKVIYHAATDNSKQTRYIADSTARLLITAHRLLPLSLFRLAIRKSIK